jgi:transposase-like protein
MKKTAKTAQEREAIIAEYLLGNTSYRDVGKKHGVDFRILHSWVNKFQGKLKKPKTKKVENQPEQPEHLSVDINKLQESLRLEKLKNKLLNSIIDIAEEQLKIDIRKKSGTKR